MLVKKACQSNLGKHTATLTVTWGESPGLSMLLVELTWLGRGLVNLWSGWGGKLWEGEPLCRGPGSVCCSWMLWCHVQGGGGGWGCQWAWGFSLSTCIWSWARVLWGAPRAMLWGEPEELCPLWVCSWWKPPSWWPGTLSTIKVPERTYTQRQDEHNREWWNIYSTERRFQRTVGRYM